jgi:hypothetical protein
MQNFSEIFSLHRTHRHHIGKGWFRFPSNRWQVTPVLNRAWKETSPDQGEWNCKSEKNKQNMALELIRNYNILVMQN